MRSLLSAYASGALSPVEVVRDALAKIEADQRFNAWVHVAGEAALAAARESEARWAKGAPVGAMDGVPVGVKDLLAVVGQPMRRGSEAYPVGFMPAEDAPVVARMREAGAILVGKTATPDAGCKLDTSSLVHGMTRNAFDVALTAGGSSGGSAVALARGHVTVAVGTDGAGSIRVPAAYNGVFGMKPSIGRIPAPVGAFWPHATTAPMTRNVLDTAAVWNVVTAPDVRDCYAMPSEKTDFAAAAQRGVAGLRVAYATSFNGIGATPEIVAAVERAAALLAGAGAVVSAAAPVFSGDPLVAFMVFWRCMYTQSIAMMPPEQAALVDPVIKNIVAQAEGVTRRDILAAQTVRDDLAMSMARFHQDYDVFLLPVMPCQPWVAGRATPPEYAEDEWGWCPFAYPFNLTRQPAASVPVGFDSANMPLAVQVVAAYGRDDLVFRAALALEQSA